MPTSYLWAGNGVYSGARTTWLSTEMGAGTGLASLAISTIGAAFQNTAAYVYADVEFLAGGTFTPVAPAYIELWLMRSLDGGTNYEDALAGISGTGYPPARLADIVIPVRAGTTITPRAGAGGLILPPGFYKPVCRNVTGAALPSSGNIISFATYSMQY